MDKMIIEFDLNKEFKDKFQNHNVTIDKVKDAFLKKYRILSETGCFLVYMPSPCNSLSEALLCKLENAIGKAEIIKEENNIFTIEANVTHFGIDISVSKKWLRSKNFTGTARWIVGERGVQFILLSVKPY